ncbi:Polyphosphoinositide phosphatase [Echinococcus granulosus]|nr:Polyphosphoinositide phosphatase [Echinococcus granulosus]
MYRYFSHDPMLGKMDLRPYVNWMQRFTIYGTQDDIYVVASDVPEKHFRVMKISRRPADIRDPDSKPTLSSETNYDLKWRLDIQTDSRTYTRKELACFLRSVKAMSLTTTPVTGHSSNSSSNQVASLPEYNPTVSAALPHSAGSCHPLTKSLTGVGLVGFIRFLAGYYLIVITQRREVARIGEHRIYKIEETKMVYIPAGISVSSSGEEKNKNLPTVNPPEESRYLKMFQGLELNRHVYFSYTYDLTRCLQTNMEPLGVAGDIPDMPEGMTAFRMVPDSRFLWNSSLLPPRFQPNSSATSDWFVGLVHGFVKQASLVSCGMPISIILVARRSRFFAGTRFLKRGINIDGNVANEVETEQMVLDTAEPTLSRMRVSSLVQHRGSVPLFWSQDTARLVVGKPPLAITWEDPSYEAFGKHFADLIERHGAPVIVLNLMKQREKRRFEQQLTDGLLGGIQYLNQFVPKLRSPENWGETIPPITYVSFDMARIKRSQKILSLDRLKVIAEECVRRTGLFFSAGRPTTSTSLEEYIQRARLHMGSNLCPRQQGLVRTNCVDCLDRTNTAQFVIGHVAAGYQLRALGLLARSQLSFDSIISRLLRDLYEEHGDALALQYGGSGVVHNIETYQNPYTSRVTSRDIVQTISRYYSNNFVDFEKQLATDLFLRIFRPGAGPLVLPPAGEWRRPEDAVAVAAAMSVRSGQAFLFSSDPAFEAYIHWLQAWATLPPYRTSLTTWFPRSTFLARQRALRGWGTWTMASDSVTANDERSTSFSFLPDTQKSFQFLQLTEHDPGGDWFSELYRPYDWTHFYDLTCHQLPLATNESGFIQERPSLNPPHIGLVASACLTDVVQSCENNLLSEVAAIEEGEARDPEGGNQNTPYNPVATNTQAPPTVAAHTPSSLSVSNNGEDMNTSDSTSQDSDTSAVSKCLLQRGTTRAGGKCRRQPSFPPTETSTPALAGGGSLPLLTKFTRVRLSELTSWMQRGGTTTTEGSERPTEREESRDGKGPRDRKGSWFNAPRRFGLGSNSSSIKLRKPSSEDMGKYRKYASIPLASVDISLSDILIVSPTSMAIYRNALKLSQTGTCSTANESLSMYQRFMNVIRSSKRSSVDGTNGVSATDPTSRLSRFVFNRTRGESVGLTGLLVLARSRQLLPLRSRRAMSDGDLFASPFLNIDPSLLVNDPSDQFIFPEGDRHRGRFERSFSEIGSMVIGGCVFGGTRALYSALKDPELIKLPTKALQRTQILNHVTKSGASWAQTAGSIGLIYAISDFVIHKLRGGADDEINMVSSATATGLLYRSPGLFAPGGWQRCLRGGAFGLTIGLAGAAFTSWDRIKELLGA